MKQMAAAPDFAEANRRIVEQAPFGHLTEEDAARIAVPCVCSGAIDRLRAFGGQPCLLCPRQEPIEPPS